MVGWVSLAVAWLLLVDWALRAPNGAGKSKLRCPYLLSSETTAKGTGLAESAGKEDPVELDSSLAL